MGKVLRLGSVGLILVLMLSMLSCVVADKYDPVVQKEIKVKQGGFFKLPLENPEKRGYHYFWVVMGGQGYIMPYTTDDRRNWTFEALKKGKTDLTIEVFEIDPKGHSEFYQSVQYPINIT